MYSRKIHYPSLILHALKFFDLCIFIQLILIIPCAGEHHLRFLELLSILKKNNNYGNN